MVALCGFRYLGMGASWHHDEMKLLRKFGEDEWRVVDCSCGTVHRVTMTRDLALSIPEKRGNLAAPRNSVLCAQLIEHSLRHRLVLAPDTVTRGHLLASALAREHSLPREEHSSTSLASVEPSTTLADSSLRLLLEPRLLLPPRPVEAPEAAAVHGTAVDDCEPCGRHTFGPQSGRASLPSGRGQGGPRQSNERLR